jgi:GT2 family glycosyltransferase
MTTRITTPITTRTTTPMTMPTAPTATAEPPVRLSIQLVTYNSAPVMDAALESLLAQTSRAFEVIVVDNASVDDSAERAAAWFARGLRGRLVRSPENTGFCGGNNQAFREGTGEWVLLFNPDAVLPPDFVERALALADAQPADVGTIAPLILLNDGMVDSTGLFMDRFRRLKDRGHGESPEAYGVEEDVPAATGAIVFHRRSMLLDIAQDDEVPGMPFDERVLWMYYDDWDVGIRARRRGWRVRYLPSLVARHGRAGRSALRQRRKRKRNRWEQTMMVRNRYLQMAKTDPVLEVVRCLPWLVPFEIARFGYLLLTAPGALRGYGQAIAALPRALRVRRRVGVARWGAGEGAAVAAAAVAPERAT